MIACSVLSPGARVMGSARAIVGATSSGRETPSQFYPPHPVSKERLDRVSDREREPRLPHASGTHQRQKVVVRIPQKPGDLLDLVITAD